MHRSSSRSERMAGVGGTQQSLRKAFGVLKDSTMVGLAKVNSENKDLDVAIVKATNHVEQMAKEKHIRTIFEATSASRPRADVSYCINALARRLAKTHNWAVALKTLVVIHRALREVDPTFCQELIKYSRSRGHMLNLSHFKDDSSPNAWDYSAWVRTYALYLEERLECFRVLKYDVEIDRIRTRELDTIDLLEQLPALQQLLYRLLACQPEGAAVYNNLIQNALSMVAGESIKLYNAINDGTLNLVDKFFEMQRHDAVRALEIYRKAGQQAERLSEFYEICRGLDPGRGGQKFIKIEQPPESFVTAMEEYVKDAPRALPSHRNAIGDSTDATPKVVMAIEYNKTTDMQENLEPHLLQPEPSLMPPEPVKSDAPVTTAVTDLLGLDEFSQNALELDKKNAVALAIIPPENQSNTASDLDLTSVGTGWELALVSAPSSNENAVLESKLAGGLDMLTLDSLYDNAMATRTNEKGQVAPNPFGLAEDPFYASNHVAPPANVQMAAMAQQQAFMQQQHAANGNPFGNPYASFQPYQSHNPYTGYI